MFKWVPYSQRYLVLGLVGLVGLVGLGLPTVTVRVSRVSVMVSVRDSVKCAWIFPVTAVHHCCFYYFQGTLPTPRCDIARIPSRYLYWTMTKTKIKKSLTLGGGEVSLRGKQSNGARRHSVRSGQYQ